MKWKVFNVVDSAVRWGVPIFVMISGAMMLDNDRALSFKKLYGQKILRIIIAFVFWSAVYAMNKMYLGANVRTVESSFIQGNYHMWFMHMIIDFFFTFLIPGSIHLLECMYLSWKKLALGLELGH